MGHEDLKKEFERYQEEHKGEPIDPKTIEDAKRERLLDELHHRPEYSEGEPDRAAIVASLPEGRLSETDIADKDIPEVIEKLTAARETLVAALNLEILGDPQETSFQDLCEVAGGAEDSEHLPGEMDKAVRSMESYMKIDPEEKIFDLPEAINEFLALLARKQSRPKNNTEG